MRRFALSTLKDFGMGKRITEGKIIEECGYLIEEFQQHEGNIILTNNEQFYTATEPWKSYTIPLLFLGEAFDNAHMMNYAASNIISALMFGKRFEYKDPEIKAMLERNHEVTRLTGTASILVLQTDFRCTNLMITRKT